MTGILKKSIGILFLLTIFGCSLSNEDAKITVNIPPFSKTRSVKTDGVQASGENLSCKMLEISVKGDYEESAEVEISNGATVIFDSVPAGSEVYVEAYLYYKYEHADYPSEENHKEYFYKGKSSSVKIASGENQISLKLKGRTYGSLNANSGTFESIDISEKFYYAYNSINDTVRFGGLKIPLASELGLKRSGYDFAGWSKESGGSVDYADGADIQESESVTLYAVWKSQ